MQEILRKELTPIVGLHEIAPMEPLEHLPLFNSYLKEIPATVCYKFLFTNPESNL